VLLNFINDIHVIGNFHIMHIYSGNPNQLMNHVYFRQLHGVS